MSALGPMVTVNPDVAAGQPLIRGTRVKDVQDRLDAGDSVGVVSRAFGLSLREISVLNRPEWRRLVRRFTEAALTSPHICVACGHMKDTPMHELGCGHA
jgi:uncharacterized protein (DUF433 family)